MLNELLKAANEIQDETEFNAVMDELDARAYEMNDRQLKEYLWIAESVRRESKRLLVTSL